MVKKLTAMLLLFVVLFSLSACGKSNPVFDEIEAIEATYEFPVPETGKYTLNSAYVHIKPQQTELLEAYVKNIEITDIKLFENKIDAKYRNKLITALNDKRMELDKAAEEIFLSNMEIILSEVVNCEYKEEYAMERKIDVLEFVTDYIRVLNIDNEDPRNIDKMIQNYATWSNNFATGIIHEHRDAIIDKAIVMIERNARAEESFQTYITMNNETVRAINYLFGGVGDNESFRKRINDSNYMLLEKTIEAMMDVSEEEKASMLAQLRENQRLSDRSGRQ